MNDKMEPGPFELSDLTYGVLNNFQESGMQNSVSRRRSSGQDYINSALAAANAKDALSSVSALYGIVVQVLAESYCYAAAGSRDLFLKQAEYNKNSEAPDNELEDYSFYYKVYIPEIEPRPLPRSQADPVLHTYQRVNILDSVAAEHQMGLVPGTIVKVEYGDFQNLLDPTIVGVEGSVVPSFLKEVDPCTNLTADSFRGGGKSLPGVRIATNNYVYQLKSNRLGGSELEQYEQGDIIEGDNIDEGAHKAFKLQAVVERELTFWGGWTGAEREQYPRASVSVTSGWELVGGRAVDTYIKTETMAIVQPRLKEYYSTVNASPSSLTPGDPPWSAAFISYVITKVDSSFPKSIGHTSYAKAAKQGSGGWSLFMTSTTPAHGDKSIKSNAHIKANIGDVLIKPPTGGRLTGPDANEASAHGDVVYKITGSATGTGAHQVAYLAGGNLGQTAKAVTPIALTKEGYYTMFGAYELIVKKKGRVTRAGVVITSTPTDADDAGGAAAEPAPPPSSSTGAPPAAPPVDATAEMDAAWAGQPVTPGGLEAMDCEQLWSLRNSVYARHGYAFSTARAQNYFVTDSRYSRNEDVNAGTIDNYLSTADRTNRDTIAAAEAAKSC